MSQSPFKIILLEILREYLIRMRSATSSLIGSGAYCAGGFLAVQGKGARRQFRLLS